MDPPDLVYDVNHLLSQINQYPPPPVRLIMDHHRPTRTIAPLCSAIPLRFRSTHDLPTRRLGPSLRGFLSTGIHASAWNEFMVRISNPPTSHLCLDKGHVQQDLHASTLDPLTNLVNRSGSTVIRAAQRFFRNSMSNEGSGSTDIHMMEEASNFIECFKLARIEIKPTTVFTSTQFHYMCHLAENGEILYDQPSRNVRLLPWTPNNGWGMSFADHHDVATVLTQIWSQFADAYNKGEAGQRFVVLTNLEASVLFSISEGTLATSVIQVSQVISRTGESNLTTPCNNLLSLMLALLVVGLDACRVAPWQMEPRTTRQQTGFTGPTPERRGIQPGNGEGTMPGSSHAADAGAHPGDSRGRGRPVGRVRSSTGTEQWQNIATLGSSIAEQHSGSTRMRIVRSGTVSSDEMVQLGTNSSDPSLDSSSSASDCLPKSVVSSQTLGNSIMSFMPLLDQAHTPTPVYRGFLALEKPLFLHGPISPGTFESWTSLPLLVDGALDLPATLVCAITGRLGQGAIGNIFTGIIDKVERAVKISDIGLYPESHDSFKVWTRDSVSIAIWQELDTYRQLESLWGIHVPRLHGVWASGSDRGRQQWAIIMDLLDEQLDPQTATDVQKMSLIDGYRRLHELGIVHNDVKVEHWRFARARPDVVHILDFTQSRRRIDWAQQEAGGYADACAYELYMVKAHVGITDYT